MGFFLEKLRVAASDYQELKGCKIGLDNCLKIGMIFVVPRPNMKPNYISWPSVISFSVTPVPYGLHFQKISFSLKAIDNSAELVFLLE